MAITDEQYREHVAKIERLLDELRAQGLDSRTLCGHLDRGWMRWSADRRAQQRFLLRQLWEQDASSVPRAAQAYFLAGNDVSGKVKLLADPDYPLNPDDYLVIDPYRIDTAMARRNMIPHFEGFPPMDLKVLVREESCQLAERLAQRAMSERCNIMWVLLFPEEPTQECDPGADTIRLIVQRFQDGNIEFSALVDALVRRWRERPDRRVEPATWGEIYRRAEQSPDDDDLVWISVAEDVGALSVEQAEEIFTAIESAAGEKPASIQEDDAVAEWQYYETIDGGIIRIAEGLRAQRYWGPGAGWLASSAACRDWADDKRLGSGPVATADVAAILERIDMQPGGAFRWMRFWEDEQSAWSAEQAQDASLRLETKIADTNNYDNWFQYREDCRELARLHTYLGQEPGASPSQLR